MTERSFDGIERDKKPQQYFIITEFLLAIKSISSLSGQIGIFLLRLLGDKKETT